MKEILSKEETQWLLVNNVIFKSVPFDQWEDGDFEADSMDGGMRVLISKQDGKYFVANAMNGYGHNCKNLFENATVTFLIPSSAPSPLQEAVEFAEWVAKEGWLFDGKDNVWSSHRLQANSYIKHEKIFKTGVTLYQLFLQSKT